MSCALRARANTRSSLKSSSRSNPRSNSGCMRTATSPRRRCSSNNSSIHCASALRPAHLARAQGKEARTRGSQSRSRRWTALWRRWKRPLPTSTPSSARPLRPAEPPTHRSKKSPASCARKPRSPAECRPDCARRTNPFSRPWPHRGKWNRRRTIRRPASESVRWRTRRAPARRAC